MAVASIKVCWSKLSARIRDYIDVVDSYYRPTVDEIVDEVDGALRGIGSACEIRTPRGLITHGDSEYHRRSLQNQHQQRTKIKHDSNFSNERLAGTDGSIISLGISSGKGQKRPSATSYLGGDHHHCQQQRSSHRHHTHDQNNRHQTTTALNSYRLPNSNIDTTSINLNNHSSRSHNHQHHHHHQHNHKSPNSHRTPVQPSPARQHVLMGYTKRKTAQGQIYFVGPYGQKNWHDPSVPKELINANLDLDAILGPLSSNWEIGRTSNGKTYYSNHSKLTTQLTDPRLVLYKDQLLELLRHQQAQQHAYETVMDDHHSHYNNQKQQQHSTSGQQTTTRQKSTTIDQMADENVVIPPPLPKPLSTSTNLHPDIRCREQQQPLIGGTLDTSNRRRRGAAVASLMRGSHQNLAAVGDLSTTGNSNTLTGPPPSWFNRQSTLTALREELSHQNNLNRSVEQNCNQPMGIGTGSKQRHQVATDGLRAPHNSPSQNRLYPYGSRLSRDPQALTQQHNINDTNHQHPQQQHHLNTSSSAAVDDTFNTTSSTLAADATNFSEKHRFSSSNNSNNNNNVNNKNSTKESISNTNNNRTKELYDKISILRQELLKQQDLSHPCKISIKRKNIFEESYRAISQASAKDLKKRLLIKFRGEEGLDYGGVAREWFYLLSKEILNPAHGLFQYTSGDIYNLQINPDSGIVYREHLSYFNFCGRVIGMAVFHGHFIEGRFTLPFYKMLLNKPITLSDIEYVDPELYRSLCWILDNDITDIIDTTFLVQHNAFGKLQEHELMENGRNICVTNKNKHDYVSLYVNYRCRRGIEQQFAALQRGFYEIVMLNLLDTFNEYDLELLIGGLSKINIEDWFQYTKLKNCSHETPLVRWFWDIVRSYDEDKRARLLQFVTGSPRVPIQGFKALQGVNSELRLFTIHMIRNGNTDNLPKSHTCFNRIDLPPYETYDKLRDKLTQAIEETMGFGMQ